MSRIYDRPITLQKRNEMSEEWEDLYTLHARINKASDDNEYLNAGSIRSKAKKVFEVRYFAELENIEINTQDYRIVYKNVHYNVTAYDDFMLQHKTVKLIGESY